MSASAGSIHVLLVEDSTDDIFFFRRALDKTGIAASLRVAEDGGRAIQMILEPNHPVPQLMFLDLKMPNVNGFEVLQWLNRQEFKSAIRVVVLTSSDEPREMQMARSLGAAEYLVKPVSVEKLRDELACIRGVNPSVSPQPQPQASKS
jgi:CheY-like chemotaxis protein